MAKFLVSWIETNHLTVEVEAENEEAAREVVVMGDYTEQPVDDVSFDGVTDVELIEED